MMARRAFFKTLKLNFFSKYGTSNIYQKKQKQKTYIELTGVTYLITYPNTIPLFENNA